ncbi:magnesium transporter NIPA-domain-containing protein [Sporodiniella umbellata]|nr:magnesium transporter NIPA-domain-containing protein [Sporodiniella umbellata]
MDKPVDTDDISFSTFIGVLVSVLGNALISVALNLQKRAHNKIQEKQLANYFSNMDDPPQWITTTPYNGFCPDDGYSSPRSSIESSVTRARSEAELIEHQKVVMAMAQEQTKGDDTQYLKSKLWWLGISLMILGEVGNFVAYGFAPASTIAPLGTTTLVSNVILAPLMLKEVFRKRDLLGVFLAVSGAAVVVLSSNSEEVALSPELIMEAITQTQSIIYFILTTIAIIVLTILSPIHGASSIMIDLGLVAIYGGYTVLSTKSVASLLSLSFLKMFAYPVSYVLIAVLVITAVLQIKYLNKALQRFDSTEVIPTQFVLFTVSAIIGSAVLYHDFDGMDYNQTFRFMTGCAIEFLGVYLITSKRTKNLPALSISADDNDNAIQLPEHHDFYRDEPRQQNRTSIIASTPHVYDEGSQNKRHSSVFGGISIASQLYDRNDEALSPKRDSGLFMNKNNTLSDIGSLTDSEHGTSSRNRELIPMAREGNRRASKLIDIEE